MAIIVWMRIARVVPIAAALFLCVVASLFAQSRVLHEIRFTGAPAYSQDALLAITGLKPGGTTTQQQIDDAAQRLNDTGLFEEVNFTGNDKGIVFALKPASGVLPVRFSNFVWWNDDDLDRTLKARVPLYRAQGVPTGGMLRDSIAAALKAMLVEKGIADATVSTRLSAPKPGAPVDHIVFSIDSPSVVIHSLALLNVSAAMQQKLERVVHDVQGEQWDKDASYADITSRVSDVYRDAGFDDIAVIRQEHSPPTITAGQIDLDVTATLSEGAQYHVAQLTWPGSELLATAEFNQQAKLKPGDLDSPIALLESLQSIHTAYGAKGYLDAKIEAPPVINHTTHQVAYTVTVLPGPQYHFKAVHWPSVSDAQAKAFNAAWEMKPGDVYDRTYLGKFLAKNSPFRKQGFGVKTMENIDPTNLTVDLTVTFPRDGTK
jgi:outer membrane protein assembly factor BamA